MNGCIYKIENKLNGKIYIGQTRRSPKKRWNEHYRNNKSNIGNDLNNYGINNFTFSVLEEVKLDDLNDKEIFYIAENDCLYPNGYNLTSGGHSSSHTENTIEKIRKSKLGKPRSKETKDKIREKLLGIPLSEERRINISKAHYKKVKCIETGIIYNSVQEAAKDTNTKDTHISRVCKGKRKTTGGFHWESVLSV